MHVRIVLGIVSAALWLCSAASAQELTERDAVSLFLTRSPHAQEFRAGTAVVEAQTRGWSVWPNPQAAFEHEGAGLTQTTRIQQGLPINGRLGLLRQAATAAAQVAGAQAEFNLWRLCSEMRLAFYDLIFAQQREMTFNGSLAQLREVVRVLGERERHGEGSLFDPVGGLAFDHIASNPPIRAGKAVVHGIVDGASAHLLEGGSLWLVARAKQGAPSLREKMRATMGNAETVRRGSGFWVLRSIRRSDSEPPLRR